MYCNTKLTASQCGFVAQPHESLVKRGCFFWKPHPCAFQLFPTNSFFSWFSSSANINQHFSNYLPSSSLCPSFLSRIAPAPRLWYSGATSDWQWETSWGRDKRWEKPAPALLSSQYLWKENPPQYKERSIFCVRKHLRPLLVVTALAPLAQSHPCYAFPVHGSSTFHCFPFVTHSSLNFYKERITESKYNPKWYKCTTFLRVRCYT